jgi:hypothetical protein
VEEEEKRAKDEREWRREQGRKAEEDAEKEKKRVEGLLLKELVSGACLLCPFWKRDASKQRLTAPIPLGPLPSRPQEFSSAAPDQILSQVASLAAASAPTIPPPPPLFASSLRLRRSAASQAPTGPPPPYKDPFYSYDDRYNMLDSYDDPSTAQIRLDEVNVVKAAGFSVTETWERAVRGAVGGLGVEVLRGI